MPAYRAKCAAIIVAAIAALLTGIGAQMWSPPGCRRYFERFTPMIGGVLNTIASVLFALWIHKLGRYRADL